MGYSLDTIREEGLYWGCQEDTEEEGGTKKSIEFESWFRGSLDLQTK